MFRMFLIQHFGNVLDDKNDYSNFVILHHIYMLKNHLYKYNVSIIENLETWDTIWREVMLLILFYLIN